MVATSSASGKTDTDRLRSDWPTTRPSSSKRESPTPEEHLGRATRRVLSARINMPRYPIVCQAAGQPPRIVRATWVRHSPRRWSCATWTPLRGGCFDSDRGRLQAARFATVFPVAIVASIGQGDAIFHPFVGCADLLYWRVLVVSPCACREPRCDSAASRGALMDNLKKMVLAPRPRGTAREH